MPADIKTGIVRHALETSMMFLRNAALKHGIAPMPAAAAIENEPAVSPSGSFSSAPASSPQPSPGAAPGLSSALKTAGLVGLSMLAGGGTIGAVLGPYLASKGTTVVESTVPSLEVGAPASKQADKESPLQWLEDQGLNVTPKEAAGGK